MIYFIEGGDYTKIGVSDNPQKRLNELQTGNPFKLNIKFLTDGEYEKESQIHKALNIYRVKGEWFKITYDWNNELIDFLIEQSCLGDLTKIKKRTSVSMSKKQIDEKKSLETISKIKNSINIIKKNKDSATVKDISDVSGISYITTRKYIDLMADRLNFIDGFKVIKNQHKETAEQVLCGLLKNKEEMIRLGVKFNKISLHKISGVSRPTIDKYWNVINK